MERHGASSMGAARAREVRRGHARRAPRGLTRPLHRVPCGPSRARRRGAPPSNRPAAPPRSQPVASKKTPDGENLEALDAKRLAAPPIETASGGAAVKRRLRIELAGALDPSGAAGEARKRPMTIGRSRSFVDWRRAGALAGDLEIRRRPSSSMSPRRTPTRRSTRCGASWRWRTPFSTAATTAAERWATPFAPPGPTRASWRTEPSGALTRNDYGQYDGLVAVLAPALGNEGLERLKRRAVVPGPGGLKGGAGLPERLSRFAWTPNAPVRAPRCCCRLTAMDRMTPVPGRDLRRRRPGAGP